MLVLWMVYASVVAALLGGSAHLVERVRRERGREARWIWAVALALSTLVPALTWALSRPESAAPVAVSPVPLPALQVVAALDDRAAPLLDRIETPLLALWASCSLLLLALGAGSWLRLAAAGRSWTEQRIEGTLVLVSRDLGPAVVGLVRHRIVLPRWVLEEAGETRGLILAHEREHVRCRDPLLVLGGTLPALLLPWNPALWWQLSRLRLAVELDCDRRVLGEASSPLRRRYGALLLEAGAKGRRGWLRAAARGASMAAAFSERPSFLETRIREITRAHAAPAVRRAAGLGGAAVVLLVVACLVPGPETSPTDPEEEAASATDISAAPVFTPFSKRPELLNTAEVREALSRSYPAALRELGIGGSPVVWFFIGAEGGAPRDVRLNRTSGNERLDQAALAVARIMRFAPALNRDQAVPVWVSLPITFRPSDPPAAAPSERGDGPVAAGAAGGEASDAIRGLRERAAATAAGPVPAPPTGGLDEQEGPRFTPFTVRPELRDVAEVTRALEEEYPRLLREAGIGGTATVFFFIDATGEVRQTLLNESSGNPPLDEAALRVARRMRFTPALNGERPVEVWVSLPITFQPDGGR